MPNTYTQIYIHSVFAVQGRYNLIPRRHNDELCKYITGIVSNRGQKLIAINGEPDHMHIFVGLRPTMTISDLVRDIKAGSSGFINEKQWVPGKFHWQAGFGAFSHSHSNIQRVVQYIQNQQEHHKKQTFQEEYLQTLKEYAVEFDDQYLFEWINLTDKPDTDP